MKNSRNILINSTVLICSIFAVLLALEAALAVFYPSKIVAKPFFHIQSFFCEYDSILGWRNKPNYSGIVRVDNKASFRVTHNSHGQRGKDHNHQKPSGKTRILALGDSFVWGFGVEDHEVFSTLIEQSNSSLEVINTGVSGYGTDQEFLSYTEGGYKYNSDLVVLAFYSNDLNEIATSMSYGYPKPIATTDDNILTFWNVPVPQTEETELKMYGNPSTLFGKVKRFLRRHTNIYPFIAGRINSVQWIRDFTVRIGLGEKYGRNLRNIPFMQNSDKNKNLIIFERLLTDLAAEVRKNGAQFLLINLPVKEKRNGKERLPDSEKHNNDISLILTEISQRRNIQFINLLQPVRDLQSNGTNCYSDSEFDIHFNRRGHKLLSDTIINWLNSNQTTK